MNKKLVLLLTALLVCAVTFTCSYSVGAKETVDFRFVGMEYYEWTLDWWQNLAKEFERLNPDIKVNVEVVPWDMGFERYNVWVKGGMPPTAGTGGAKWTAEFVAMDALEPLDAYLAKSPSIKNNVFASLLEATKIDGHYYALPVAAAARGLFYNKDILAKAGVNSPPTTWEEFIEVAKKVHNPPYTYAFAYNAGDHEAIWNFMPWLVSAGGDLVGPDGKWKLNAPENVEALEFVKKFARDLKLTQPAPTGARREDVSGYFIGGKAAMMIECAEMIARIERDNPKLNYGICKAPAYRAPGTIMLIDTMYLFRGGKNKDAAWKFIEFFYEDKNQLDWCRKLNIVANTQSVAKVWPIGEKDKFLASLLPEAKMYPVKIGWDVVQEEVVKAVQSVLLGTKTPKEALDYAQKRVEERVGK